MVMTIKQLIKQMDNKNLLYTLRKIKKEKANPQTYGKYGTSNWVTQSEFWSGHIGNLKAELKRRQKLGKISKRAGK